MIIARKTLPLFLAGLLCASAAVAHAQVISETFESETVGWRTYSGTWSYIYTEPTSSGRDVFMAVRDGFSIGGGAGSPTGGKYLLAQTDIGHWQANAFVGSGGTLILSTSRAWESPAGHLYRREMLDAGATYNVSSWQSVETTAGVIEPSTFSIWDGSSVNTTTPFLSTPGSLLAQQAYDAATGGWQLVTISFTAPGTLGSGTVPVDFMMGAYTPGEVPTSSFADWVSGELLPEVDGNPRTIDGPEDFSTDIHQFLQYHGYALDDFTLTQVSGIPEPSVSILGGIGALMLTRRRHSRAGA
ncbi:MAG: hypothetical protein JWL81_1968 [Verrucomicrobiales bacterium]|nr:hypothetical protein [Verrucomicrobiales bacterium]